MSAAIDPRLLALRARREALLLKSRTVKNTATWHREYRAVTAALNALAAELRRERWKNLDFSRVIRDNGSGGKG